MKEKTKKEYTIHVNNNYYYKCITILGLEKAIEKYNNIRCNHPHYKIMLCNSKDNIIRQANNN